MESSRQLRVTGEGTLSAEPDRWALVAAINAMADSAADALTKVNQLVVSATRALVDAGIDRSSLRTQNLLLHDYFDQAEQHVTARVASYELEVSTTSVDALGSVIASLGALLDNNLQIRGIRPTVADPEPLYQEAQARAVSMARAKAQALAQSSEVTLGRILSIDEQRSLGAQIQGTSNTAFRSLGGRAVIPPMPVEPGVLSVRAFVTIVYEIQ